MSSITNVDLNTQAPSSNTQTSAMESYYGYGTVAESLYGIPFNDDIKEKEGRFSGVKDDGTSGILTSRTFINTLDLVSEGPIEGLVSGEWTLQGDPYDRGYTSKKRYKFNGVFEFN